MKSDRACGMQTVKSSGVTDGGPSLKRQLGAVTVGAVVVGNILGSGIFFTPGELAAVAQHEWQVYFVWVVCGIITLCGALTLAELSGHFPHSGSTFHSIRAGFARSGVF